MILKSLTVKHWGCLIMGAHLGDFAAGTNIVYGPNESGKSTLMDALTRGLFDRHKMRSVEIRAKQPWGTTSSPEVAIEFEQNGKQYRVEKRFLSGQRCELWHQVNGQMEPFADGDNADDRLLEILESDRPGSGATQPKHWGLAQLLWLPQGQFWLPEDGLNKESRNRLHSVLGEMLIRPEFNAIESRVQRLYNESFTPVRAELRAGSEPKELEEKLAEARERFNELRQRWADLDGLNREIVELEAKYAEAEEVLKQERPKLAGVEEALKEAQRRANAREVAQREVQIKEDAWREINRSVREIQQVREELSKLRDQETAQEEVYQSCASEVEKAEENVNKAEEFLDKARQREKEAESKVKLLNRSLDLVRIRRDAADLSDTLEQLKELSERRESVEAELRDLHAPSDDEMKELQRLHDAARDARARLEASALRIRFELQMQFEGAVAMDGEKEPFTYALKADKALEWQAVQNFDLEMRGIGRFSVSSGSGEVQDLKADLEKKEQNLRSAIAPFGGADLDELADKNTRAGDLRVQIKQTTFQEKARAPKGIEALMRKQDALEAQRKQILETYPELEDDESSEEEVVEAQKKAEQESVKASTKVRSAEEQSKVAQEALREAESNQNEAKTELTKIRTRIEQQKSRENELVADGMTDAERQEKLSKALDELDQARQRLDRIPPVENLGEREDAEKRSRRDVKELEERLRGIENALNQKLGELRRAEGEGLYSRLSEAEEQVTLLESRYQSALTRANSVKLLRDTILACRQEALENVVVPVSQQVSQAFQRLAGEHYGEIQLNEEFIPESIVVQARDTEAKPDSLSYGTREQLNILVRVTLGEILAEREEQRQLVVLDDPLAHTDPGRHRLMLELLQEAAEKLQLIILTCRPGDYAWLDAKSFDLEELKRF